MRAGGFGASDRGLMAHISDRSGMDSGVQTRTVDWVLGVLLVLIAGPGLWVKYQGLGL